MLSRKRSGFLRFIHGAPISLRKAIRRRASPPPPRAHARESIAKQVEEFWSVVGGLSGFDGLAALQQAQARGSLGVGEGGGVQGTYVARTCFAESSTFMFVQGF